MEVITTVLKFVQVKAFLVLFIFVTMSLVSTDRSLLQGPHGGTVKKADNYYIEMNNSDKNLHAYLLDEKLKVIHDKAILGEVELFYTDSVTLNVQLKSYPGGAFVGDVASGFYGCKITFKLSGKSVSATFDNMAQIVKKNRNHETKTSTR